MKLGAWSVFTDEEIDALTAAVASASGEGAADPESELCQSLARECIRRGLNPLVYGGPALNWIIER